MHGNMPFFFMLSFSAFFKITFINFGFTFIFNIFAFMTFRHAI